MIQMALDESSEDSSDKSDEDSLWGPIQMLILNMWFQLANTVPVNLNVIEQGQVQDLMEIIIIIICLTQMEVPN